jgi:hypothetical protein
MAFHDFLDDPFLVQKLNPVLLEALKGYWQALKNAKASDEEKNQIRDALYNLVRFAFRHLFYPLYLKYSPQVKGTVFLLSAVHSDGIGDYMAMLKCARLLRETHPELKIEVVYTHKQKLPDVDPAFYLLKKENFHSFDETEDPASKILEGVLEGKAAFFNLQEMENLQREKLKIMMEYENLKNSYPDAASALKELADEKDWPIHMQQYFVRKREEAERLYARMKESPAIIHIALALNTFDNPELSEKSLYFAEAGNFQGIGNYLQRRWYSLGLGPFEEGIFLKAPQASAHWEDITLSRYLWKKEQPEQDLIQNYLKDHSLHVGYLPRIPELEQIYIELICRRCVQDDRSIDILLPRDKERVQNFSSDWLASIGITKVIAVECAKTIKETIMAEINLPSEKILRLIYALPVASSDFNKLIQLSGELVGCTGDGSLADCIIAEKIPFYEVRQHKKGTLEAIRHLARILTLPDVMEYFQELELCADWPAVTFIEKFEKLLNEGTFKIQWKTLVDFIRRYYCFEDSFLAHVNRHLFSASAWEIIEKEEMLVEDYFEKTITAEEAYETLEKMLRNRI